MHKHKNISFLVLTLLILLFYPGIIKLVHVHDSVQSYCETGKGSSFISEDKACLVCDFQFVSFIETQPDQLKVYLENGNAINSEIPESVNIRYLTYFSLRAPPLI